MDSVDGLTHVILTLAVIAGLVLIFRLIGAWMLRINEVIDQLHQVNDRLNKTNERLGHIQEILLSIDKKDQLP